MEIAFYPDLHSLIAQMVQTPGDKSKFPWLFQHIGTANLVGCLQEVLQDYIQLNLFVRSPSLLLLSFSEVPSEKVNLALALCLASGGLRKVAQRIIG